MIHGISLRIATAELVKPGPYRPELVEDLLVSAVSERHEAATNRKTDPARHDPTRGLMITPLDEGFEVRHEPWARSRSPGPMRAMVACMSLNG